MVCFDGSTHHLQQHLVVVPLALHEHGSLVLVFLLVLRRLDLRMKRE
jgi:hypothetical protein